MRRALGKGLAQLLGEQPEVATSEVSIKNIRPAADQPRKHFDEDALAELADSIREVGILQPIVVRPTSDGDYEIIAGERRWRAAQLAGLSNVPVTVRTVNDESALQLALIENVQREDISAMECAFAYKQLADQFDLNQEEIAQRVGKTRVTIANTLRLLKLPAEVQQGLTEGLITEGHARALLAAESQSRLLEVFYRIVDEGMTVRETEKLLRSGANAKKAPEKAVVSDRRDPNLVALENTLSERFGSPTRFAWNGSKGFIRVELGSEDDIDRILSTLQIQL